MERQPLVATLHCCKDGEASLQLLNTLHFKLQTSKCAPSALFTGQRPTFASAQLGSGPLGALGRTSPGLMLQLATVEVCEGNEP